MRICHYRNSRRGAPGGWYIALTVLAVFFPVRSHALTRWSAVQFVPDADMLEGGSFVLTTHGYYYRDIIDGGKIRPTGTVNFGIIEWVNIETGYTGGFTLGIKARILGETRPWMPSLAIGVHNLFSHREAYLYDRLSDSLGSELYLVLGKSIEPARLRFHLGMQMIPGNQSELFNPFFVIEKYFGQNLYVTAEVHRRDEKMHPSLFASWRFWKRRFEVSTGIVDITGMFMNDEAAQDSPFYSSTSTAFVRPGVWFGLRFKGGFRFGKTDGLKGIENSLYSQSASINEMRGEIDSLKQLLRNSPLRMETMDHTTDSSLTDTQRFRERALDRLAVLVNLYSAEPFEPEAVNKAMAELIADRDRMLPALYEIVFDPVQETAIRSLAITALGEIGTHAAADMIIEVLDESTNPEITIECLIALGKMKETRAVYLMQRLSNDPDDDVAFTAAEVLQKLEKETGISVTPIPAATVVPESIPEKKIGSDETHEPRELSPQKSAAKPTEKTVVKPADFSEAPVAGEPSVTTPLPKSPKPETVSAAALSQPPPPAPGISKTVSDTVAPIDEGNRNSPSFPAVEKAPPHQERLPQKK